MSHLYPRWVPGTVLPYVETCGPSDRATGRITAQRSVGCPHSPPSSPNITVLRRKKKKTAGGRIAFSLISHRCCVRFALKSDLNNNNYFFLKKNARVFKVFSEFHSIVFRILDNGFKCGRNTRGQYHVHPPLI